MCWGGFDRWFGALVWDEAFDEDVWNSEENAMGANVGHLPRLKISRRKTEAN